MHSVPWRMTFIDCSSGKIKDKESNGAALGATRQTWVSCSARSVQHGLQEGTVPNSFKPSETPRRIMVDGSLWCSLAEGAPFKNHYCILKPGYNVKHEFPQIGRN